MAGPEAIGAIDNSTSPIPTKTLYTRDNIPVPVPTDVPNDMGLDWARIVRTGLKDKVNMGKMYAEFFPNTPNVLNIGSDKNFFIDGNNIFAYQDSTSRGPMGTGLLTPPYFDEYGVVAQVVLGQQIHLCC